jgi:hypothetical protein
MPSAPATCYVALFNGSPKTTGTEVTTTIRAAGRVAIAYRTSYSLPAFGSFFSMAVDPLGTAGDKVR